MAGIEPSSKDIETLFKRLRSIPANKFCFDCAAKNPTWASVTYGVFICIDCSAVHRSLGVHLTFVRSTLFDTNWTWVQLHKMQLGGNSNAKLFFVQHNCTTKDFQTKYNSRTAQLYKEKLDSAANQAITLHGHKLNLEPEPHVEEKEKELDFFDEHTGNLDPFAEGSAKNLSSSRLNEETEKNKDIAHEPSPGVLLSSTACEGVRKPTIGMRSSQSKRSGLANKKMGGLGAQKVNVNFDDIEKEAELAEKLRTQDSKIEDAKFSLEAQEEQLNSMRLAYQDLSLKQKKEEEKMKAVDPKKAKQLERLGMGFASRSGVSHSALEDMKTIQQENVQKSPKSFERENDDFFDDFGFSSNQSSSSYMFKSASESQSLSAMLGENKDMYGGNKTSEHHESKLSYEKSFDKLYDKPFEKSYDKLYEKSPKKASSTNSVPGSSSAQQKFGSAKSISSDQYFSDKSDSQWERKSNLSRFEGSTSISSADYFGRNETTSRGSGIASQIQTPDLEDVKESVRQGVTKVAGKLSSLANGVMSSIQEKYGL